jgi:hypothetical protein
MADDPIIAGLKQQKHYAVQSYHASLGVGLLSLATGAVSVFLVKKDRLSCANFRRLIIAAGLVALAALYRGIKAREQVRKLTQRLNQGIFESGKRWTLSPEKNSK